MEHIVGIYLHARNGYYGIIESIGNRVFQKTLLFLFAHLCKLQEWLKQVNGYREYGG